MSNSIDYRFKILYVIGMIMVVAGHCGNGGLSIGYEFIPPYSVHLQLFAFCAGYFYKTAVEGNPLAYIKKKAYHLLMPLYIWNLIYGLLITMLAYKGFTFGAGEITAHKLFLEPLISGHQFTLNLGGWFVIPLFLNQIAYMLLHRAICPTGTVKREPIVWMICLLLGTVGIWLSIHSYNTGYWLTLVHFLCFMPFYGLGAFYKNVLEKHDTMDSLWYFGIVLFLELAIIARYGHPLTYTLAFCRDFNNGIFMPLFVPMSGIAFWLRAARILSPAIGRSRFVLSIANNTFAIMLHHLLGFLIVKTFLALCFKYLPLGALAVKFDWLAYKSNVFYCPVPVGQFLLAYVVFAIIFAIQVQKLEDIVVKRIKLICKRHKVHL